MVSSASVFPSSGTADYAAACGILARALKFGINPSLKGIQTLVDALGQPQRRYVCIQVAGTNGKSSTARLIAAVLRSHGLHVGLYTSPELVAYPERMEVDGQVVAAGRFAAVIGAAAQVAPLEVTEFELITAAALLLFAEEQVDVAVLEVGLGGRWDATSVVEPSVAVITGIGLDHTKILGDTLEVIASEKAAIIKPGAAAILGPGTAKTLPVFLEQAEAAHTRPRRVYAQEVLAPAERFDEHDTAYRVEPSEDAAQLRLSVQGAYACYEHLNLRAPDYQSANIATALAAVEATLERALDTEAIQRALDHLVIPGRFETLREKPLLIIDAAHNPESARYLTHAMQTRFLGIDITFTLLLGILADKDAAGIVEALLPLITEGRIGRIVVSQSVSPRAIPAAELGVLVEGLCASAGVPVSVIPTLPEALDTLTVEECPLLATGSITVAGQVKGYICGNADRLA
jgi:dihydrofolate synthase / folylpolyglutamate synthase